MGFLRYISQLTYPRASDPASTGPLDPSESTLTLASSGSSSANDTYLIQQLYQLNEAAEAQHNLTLLDILPVIREATADIRADSVAGVAAVVRVIDFVNSTRYQRQVTCVLQEGALDEAAERLRSSIDEFKNTRRLELLRPYEKLIAGEADTDNKDGTHGATTGKKAPFPMRGLFIGFVFSASMLVVAEGVLALINNVREITARRKHCHLWAPKSLRTIGASIVSRNADAQVLGEKEVDEVDETLGEAIFGDKKQSAYRTLIINSHFFL
jgi:hypothetical protein